MLLGENIKEPELKKMEKAEPTSATLVRNISQTFNTRTQKIKIIY